MQKTGRNGWSSIRVGFEFGAFVPLFRSHGQMPYREIYNLGASSLDTYQTLVFYDKLRYRLLPYIYTVAAQTYHNDYTIMRGLVMDFPTDNNVRNIADQYMFGPAFLVSPVYEYGARNRDVYLPAGASWYDFYTAEKLEGGTHVNAAAPLAHIPLYVRAGSIVPVGRRFNTRERSLMPLSPCTCTRARWGVFPVRGCGY